MSSSTIVAALTVVCLAAFSGVNAQPPPPFQIDQQPSMRSDQAVFSQDNPTIVHRGPIFRAEVPPATTTTQQPKQTPPPLDCRVREDGNYLPPGLLCSRLYYTCSHSVSRFHWCPHDTVFNGEKGECDHYENVKDCPPIPKMTPKPTTTSTGRPTTARLQ